MTAVIYIIYMCSPESIFIHNTTNQFRSAMMLVFLPVAVGAVLAGLEMILTSLKPFMMLSSHMADLTPRRRDETYYVDSSGL
ncbi:hypothetical protein K449DRAFT_429661 [Hypoxylon sp. EC38]|nr:hypothetical protein K449DRAFT_429661 [Hypoxylon sp. EC38]